MLGAIPSPSGRRCLEMKCIFFLIIIFVSHTLLANDNKTIKSEKLSIIGGGPNSEPTNWLQYHGLKKETDNNDALITIKLGLPNIKEIIVTDLNTINNKCNKKTRTTLLHLFLEKDNKTKELSAFVPLPCLDGLKAVLELTVSTVNKKRYSKVVQLNASVGAFKGHWSSDSLN